VKKKESLSPWKEKRGGGKIICGRKRRRMKGRGRRFVLPLHLKPGERERREKKKGEYKDQNGRVPRHKGLNAPSIGTERGKG